MCLIDVSVWPLDKSDGRPLGPSLRYMVRPTERRKSPYPPPALCASYRALSSPARVASVAFVGLEVKADLWPAPTPAPAAAAVAGLQKHRRVVRKPARITTLTQARREVKARAIISSSSNIKIGGARVRKLAVVSSVTHATSMVKAYVVCREGTRERSER